MIMQPCAFVSNELNATINAGSEKNKTEVMLAILVYIFYSYQCVFHIVARRARAGFSGAVFERNKICLYASLANLT